MFDVPVYKAERDLGLAGKVRASRSFAVAALAQLADPDPGLVIPKRAWAEAFKHKVKATNEGQPDLHYLKTILVSTVWNKNDDVFVREETWAARHTPEDKRFNYEHVDEDIIGHITANYVVNDAHETVADDTAVDELPDPFHIVTPCVLYRYWDDESLQERMDSVIAEIAEGKWYVSMEVGFRDFDYALRRADGTTKVVARGEKTAFLTKHLRAYEGSGTYQDYKVGRVLRRMVFIGKGLVRNPANSASVILTGDESQPFSSSASEFIRGPEELGYVSASRASGSADTKGDIDMAADVTVAALEAENKSLKEANAGLKSQLEKGDADKAKAREDALKADLKAKEDEIAALKSQVVAGEQKLKAATEEADTLKATALESEKARAALEAEAAEKAAEAKKLARTAALAKALGMEDYEAAKMEEYLRALPDDKFDEHTKFLAEKKVAAKEPPRAAPGAKLPPKQTDKPAPAAGKKSKAEKDPAAKDADPSLLQDAEVDAKADMNGGEEGGVSKVRANVLDYFKSVHGLPEEK